MILSRTRAPDVLLKFYEMLLHICSSLLAEKQEDAARRAGAGVTVSSDAPSPAGSGHSALHRGVDMAAPVSSST